MIIIKTASGLEWYGIVLVNSFHLKCHRIPSIDSEVRYLVHHNKTDIPEKYCSIAFT